MFRIMRNVYENYAKLSFVSVSKIFRRIFHLVVSESWGISIIVLSRVVGSQRPSLP